MKLAFWSPLHGQACTTANMMAVSIMAAIQMRKRTMITQTHFNLNNLELPLVGKLEKDFYMDTGLDALIRSVKSAPLTEEIIENCSVSLIKDRLNLLIGTKQLNRSVFEEDTSKVILKILNEVEKCYDLVFIDTNAGNSEITKTILKEADIVVVNLRQNQSMIDTYFGVENENQIEGKVFYLFGSYDGDSRYSVHNIRRKYERINRNNSGVIPYNIEYADSFSDGRVMKYISRNLNTDEDSSSFGFMRDVGESLSKILRMAGLET